MMGSRSYMRSEKECYADTSVIDTTTRSLAVSHLVLPRTMFLAPQSVDSASLSRARSSLSETLLQSSVFTLQLSPMSLHSSLFSVTVSLGTLSSHHTHTVGTCQHTTLPLRRVGVGATNR